jgi:hypothetical protein
VLAILDKGHTRADVERAIGLARAAGLVLRPSLLPFTPWSTLDDHLDLFAFIDAHDLADAVDPVHLTIRLLVPPGSLLADHPEMRPHLGAFDPQRLGYRWAHPDPRMDALQRDAEALVAADARAHRPPRATLASLHALALARAGRPDAPLGFAPRFATEGAPRLTETWFC